MNLRRWSSIASARSRLPSPSCPAPPNPAHTRPPAPNPHACPIALSYSPCPEQTTNGPDHAPRGTERKRRRSWGREIFAQEPPSTSPSRPATSVTPPPRPLPPPVARPWRLSLRMKKGAVSLSSPKSACKTGLHSLHPNARNPSPPGRYARREGETHAVHATPTATRAPSPSSASSHPDLPVRGGRAPLLARPRRWVRPFVARWRWRCRFLPRGRAVR